MIFNHRVTVNFILMDRCSCCKPKMRLLLKYKIEFGFTDVSDGTWTKLILCSIGGRRNSFQNCVGRPIFSMHQTFRDVTSQTTLRRDIDIGFLQSKAEKRNFFLSSLLMFLPQKQLESCVKINLKKSHFAIIVIETTLVEFPNTV